MMDEKEKTCQEKYLNSRLQINIMYEFDKTSQKVGSTSKLSDTFAEP